MFEELFSNVSLQLGCICVTLLVLYRVQSNLLPFSTEGLTKKKNLNIIGK